MDRLRRVPAWGWALVFALLLCLLRLGSFGLWEPWELNVADRARKMVDAAALTDPSLDGKLPQAPPLGPLLAALGVKIVGATEWGVRLFGALAGVGALMALYWAGAGLLRRRAAVLAVVALGTTPLFGLSARQLTSDMPLVAALALSLGGLGRFAWPPGGRRRWLDAGAAAAGMLLGYWAGGALVGVTLPALAMLVALLAAGGLKVQPATAAAPAAAVAATPPAAGAAPAEAAAAAAPEAAPAADDTAINDGTAALAPTGAGPHLPPGRCLTRTLFDPDMRGGVVLVVLVLTGLVLGAIAVASVVAGRYAPLLGGTPRAGVPGHTFERLVRELGFGFFPWSALAFFALGRPFTRLDDEPGVRTNSRLVFVQTYLLAFAAMGFAVSSYLGLVLGEPRYVALAAIALAVGAFLDEALEGNRTEPVLGLLIAVGTVVVARDFVQSPEELASVHLHGEKVKWPGALTLPLGPIAFNMAALIAAGIYAGLAARARALGKAPAPAPAPPAPAPAAPDAAAPGAKRTRIQSLRRGVDPIIAICGRYGLQAAVGLTIVFGFWMTQVVVPVLSKHFSFKPVMQSYAKYAKENEKIGRYRVEGKGASFYSKNVTVELPTQERVIDFLRAPERVFALVSADELAALDAALKLAKVPYYAIDASSSRFLLLSNRLDPGQADDNPLKKNVWMASSGPHTGGDWNPAERPPWSWRVPVAATFGDGIEIVGADFPATMRRPGTIHLELTFRVKVRPPPGYKIFVHFDGPATPRVIGDHDPVGKVFGTAHWLPGEYIRDAYDVDVPLMTTPSGTYHVYMGFWPGGDGRRLKITTGPNDGQDRLHLGTIEVK